MTREVHEIPPAPRTARWRVVLWFRWPFALVGFLLGVYGGLWTLMLFFHASGKPRDDAILDRAPARTTGIVSAIDPAPARDGIAPVDHVSYEFVDAKGVRRDGRCFVAHDRFLVGQSAEIEFANDQPHINRIQGGRLGLLSDYLTPVFRFVFLPGIAAALLWICGVLRIRRVLVYGDIAVAEILEVRRLRMVTPGMISARFRFRDHRARLRDGWHWVHERSALGRRLLERPTHLAVVHSRRQPAWHRLVVPEYFAGKNRDTHGSLRLPRDSTRG
jgi:hypothetical protein